MKIDVVRLPQELQAEQIRQQTVVVFDVLRATTSMVTALASGATEARIFDSLEAVLLHAKKLGAKEKLLCGERDCLRPEGFDLGNSPVEFSEPRISGKTILMSTTNGTRAIVAARSAARLMAAALVNATATARVLRSIGRDVTLLCAGTNGEYAPEDMIGAGAVAAGIGEAEMTNSTIEAIQLFHESQNRLPAVLRTTQGGQNIIKAGLERDIVFAARLDVFDIAVEISGDPPVARRMIQR